MDPCLKVKQMNQARTPLWPVAAKKKETAIVIQIVIMKGQGLVSFYFVLFKNGCYSVGNMVTKKLMFMICRYKVTAPHKTKVL